MGALPGVVRTRVGYSGGVAADPTYRRVCNYPEWADWVETVQIEYDPSELSFADVLDAFFRSHGGWQAGRSGRSRQYASAIFAHDEAQAAAARTAIASRDRCGTLLEPFGQFYDAEAYHQKWVLQRKRPLFLSLGLLEPSEMLTSSAAVHLNAFAASRISAETAQRRLDSLAGTGTLHPEALRQATEAMGCFSDKPIVMYS